MLVQLFGYLLAAGVVATSGGMLLLGARWQAIEAAAYGDARRPAWFWLLATTFIAFYLAALASFITHEKTWQGWLLMVVIPAGWAAKAALVTFNPAGRRRGASIAGDEAWRKLALVRLPIAVALAGLAAGA